MSYYQEEIERFQKIMNKLPISESETSNIINSHNGEKVYNINIQKLNDEHWQKIIKVFLEN